MDGEAGAEVESRTPIGVCVAGVLADLALCLGGYGFGFPVLLVVLNPTPLVIGILICGAIGIGLLQRERWRPFGVGLLIAIPVALITLPVIWFLTAIRVAPGT